MANKSHLVNLRLLITLHDKKSTIGIRFESYRQIKINKKMTLTKNMKVLVRTGQLRCLNKSKEAIGIFPLIQRYSLNWYAYTS